LCIAPISIEAFHAGKTKEDLTFGYGQHRCVAALLAKQALAIFTEECLKLLAEIQP
jgi:cytochrome P450